MLFRSEKKFLFFSQKIKDFHPFSPSRFSQFVSEFSRFPVTIFSIFVFQEHATPQKTWNSYSLLENENFFVTVTVVLGLSPEKVRPPVLRLRQGNLLS